MRRPADSTGQISDYTSGDEGLILGRIDARFSQDALVLTIRTVGVGRIATEAMLGVPEGIVESAARVFDSSINDLLSVVGRGRGLAHTHSRLIIGDIRGTCASVSQFVFGERCVFGGGV